MFTLTTGNTFKGKAGTASAITYTIFADVVTTVDSFQTVGQGQLPSSTGDLLTTTPVPAATNYLIKRIDLANTTASPVTGIVFYVNGTAVGNQINGGFSIPANGSASYDDEGVFHVYDSAGLQVGSTSFTVTAAARFLGMPSGGTAPGAVQEMTGTQAAVIVDAATYALKGELTAAEKIELNSLDGRTSTGTNPRVFRPGDYMVGNTYDPTGAANSTTAFQAMMTAIATWNDRAMIQLQPGVFKVDHDVLKNFGTNNPSVPIRGPGRGTCVLLPNAAPATAFSAMIKFNRNTTGSDAIAVSGFTIYNTTGTPYTQGAGIITNGADGIDISEVAFVDLFDDIEVTGEPHTMTTTVGTALSGVSPVFVAADVGQVVSGPGIPPGTTLAAQSGSTGTLSGAGASVATTATRFLNNSIKVSMQKIVSFNTNGNGNGCMIVVNNGQAGDTYIGPDVVASDGGGTTRRRACIELIESGHYEIIQCNLTGSQRGILIDPGANQVVGFGFHTNVLCDSNTINGMLMDVLATTATIKNIKSVNSWYSGTTVVNGSAAAAGVKTQATAAGAINGVTHSADRFLNNRTHGYEHAKGTDFRFSDCDMKGNSQVGSATADGLNVAAAVSNWSVNGGKYGGTDTLPTAGLQRYGINIAAGAGDNIKIAADDLTGNVTGPLSNGATGLNVFVSGCPGLAAPYTRGASSASITTVITVSNMLIPKNSVRVGTTFKVTAQFLHSGAGVTPTFTARIGATNDAVGSAATNAIIVSAVAATGAANAWGVVEGYLTITAIGASGNIQGNLAGVQAQVAFGTATAARASGAGFLAVDTTADRYLTLALVVTTAGATVHNATIEVVNY